MENYIPYITSLILGIPGIIALIKQGKKDEAEIENIDTQTKSILLADALKLKDEINEQLENMREIVSKNKREIITLKGALTRLKKRVIYLREGIDVLITQIKNLGGIPAWIPEDIDNPEN